MPNHITTKIEFVTKGEEILEYIKNEEQLFDFNKVIPMPESLDVEESSLSSYAFLYTLTDKFQNLHKFKKYESKLRTLYIGEFDLNYAQKYVKENDVENNPEFLKLGEQLLNNYEEYGYLTWYQWSTDNWGTKWNAYDVTVEGNVLKFDTAWNYPAKIINILIEKFKPTCSVKSMCEGSNFWFIKNYVAGDLVFKSLDDPADHDPLLIELKGWTQEEIDEVNAENE